MEWAQTIEAILEGGSREQLPAERVLSLSGVIGNSALAELFELRETGPGFAPGLLPRGECATEPAEIAEQGEPRLVSPPESFASGSLGSAQPLMM